MPAAPVAPRARPFVTAGVAMAMAVALTAAAAPARAATCPAPRGGQADLTSVDARTRLDWIDAHLTRAGAHARLWTWAWGWGIGASGVASLAVVPFVARDTRVDWYTSAGSAAIGVLPFLFSPLDVAHDGPALHAWRATFLSGDPAGDICPLLARAEDLLVRDADNQRRQQAWWFHAGNIAFNTGIALFLGLGFHHWEAGIINGVAGAAVGEAIILTQPTATIDDLRAYRAGIIGATGSDALTWTYRSTY